jgi:hypothetical protein
MARDGTLAKIGLGLGIVVALVVMGVVVLGWLQQRDRRSITAPASKLAPSSAGWETRYSAVVALARRGSDAVKNCIDLLEEMLNEDQQLQNYRTKQKDGRELPNEAEAFQSLTNTLRALRELHRRKPEFDLTRLQPAIDRLAQSPNPALRSEAERTKIDLGIK